MLNLAEIGKYIAKLRTDRKMSQQDLADALYVTHQAVSKWETGKAIPTIDIMVNLTKLFDITIDQLLRCGDETFDNDFAYLLKSYPREYVINQYIQGKIDVKFEDMFYLLSVDEREVVISHIINRHLQVKIPDILPYLNQIERRRIILAISAGLIECDKAEISHMLTKNEVNQLIGGKHEYQKNYTVSR